MKWLVPDCLTCGWWMLTDVALDILDDETLQKTVAAFHALDHPEQFTWRVPREEQL